MIEPVAYKFLLWAIPILLGALIAILIWIGNKTIDKLESVSRSVHKIDITLSRVAAKHDDLEKRVTKIEAKELYRN